MNLKRKTWAGKLHCIFYFRINSRCWENSLSPSKNIKKNYFQNILSFKIVRNLDTILWHFLELEQKDFLFKQFAVTEVFICSFKHLIPEKLQISWLVSFISFSGHSSWIDATKHLPFLNNNIKSCIIIFLYESQSLIVSSNAFKSDVIIQINK